MRNLLAFAALASAALALTACNPDAPADNGASNPAANSTGHERPCPPPRNPDGTQPACD